MHTETIEEERERIIMDGSEAEKLINHPMISGFFSREIDDVFNSFCTMRPGTSYEQYLRLHMEAHCLLSLKAKLYDYINEKSILLDKENFDRISAE